MGWAPNLAHNNCYTLKSVDGVPYQESRSFSAREDKSGYLISRDSVYRIIRPPAFPNIVFTSKILASWIGFWWWRSKLLTRCIQARTMEKRIFITQGSPLSWTGPLTGPKMVHECTTNTASPAYKNSMEGFAETRVISFMHLQPQNTFPIANFPLVVSALEAQRVHSIQLQRLFHGILLYCTDHQ